MLNRWLRQLRRKVFGTLDRVVPAPAITRIHRKSRSRYRPRIEELETRLAPAVTVGWDSGSDTLYIQAANSASAPAAISVAWNSTNGGTWTIQTSGDTMALDSGNSSGLSLNSADTVLTTTDQINNVTIGGPNGGTTGAADTADTVDLGTVPISGSLIVYAGTINFQGGTAVPYQGTVTIASLGNNQYTITMPATGPGWAALKFAKNDSITTAYGGLNASATIDSVSADGDTLTVASTDQPVFATYLFIEALNEGPLQNTTVTVNGAQVQAAKITLDSVNSLQTQSTAVSYFGNVAIHAAAPTGQPYAGYPYLTGPNWGAYGYQPGDTVTISSSAPEFNVATTSSTTDITTITDAANALQKDPSPTISTEPVIDFNYNESSSDLHSFGNTQPSAMPADSTGQYTNYVIHATADVYIPSAGTWTFGTKSDDGVQLLVGNTTVLDHNTTTSPTDTFGTYTATSPGLYPLDLLYFNHKGPGCVQLFAAQGNWNSFSDANFELIGDTAAGGLSVTTVGVPSGYTVANTVGDNLYLVDPAATLPPGNYSGVTVAIASGTFTPQINASNSLSLNVTGLENAITGAVATNKLAATTKNGNITLEFPGSVTLTLTTIDAGNANIVLDAQGSILSGNPLPGNANLIAGNVDLTTTGMGNSIGSAAPLSTAIAELTAATNDGSVFVANANGASALTIDSVVADQDGQAPTVNDGQVVYNSTPDQLTPTYGAGSSNVTIYSQGPIILNSISATGSVEITGMYLVEGNGQTPSIIAPTVYLWATGVANYEGPVTFANSSGGDTLTLPGAFTTIASGSNGASLPQSTIAVASTTGFPSSGTIAITTGSNTVFVNYTGTTATSFTGCSGGSGTLATGAAVTMQAWTSYGFLNGKAMAGYPIVVSGASDSGNDGTFTVKSISGNTLTLQQPNVLDPETELLVSVGDGMIGLENSSSPGMSSSAATAQSPVELSEVGNFTAITTNGNIFLTLGGSVDSTAVNVQAGGTGNVAVTSQASFLTIENTTANGAVPTGASSVVGGAVAVGMNSGALIEYPSNYGMSNQEPGIIAGQYVALTSPLSIGSPSSPLLTKASSGLSVTATATSPSSAAVYIDNTSNLTSLGVSTYDGTVAINYDKNTSTSTYAGMLLFSNTGLSASGGAVVSFTNSDENDGSNDNVQVNGTIDASNITAGGRILAQAGTNALITGQAVELSAGTGIGIGTAVTALAASTNTGNIEINQSAPSTTGSGATVDLSTDNAVGAIISVTLDSGGSGYPANSMVLLMVTGGGGTGGVVEAATNSFGFITSIVSLVAANGASTDVVAAGDGYTNTSGAATSGAFMLLSASTSNGLIDVNSSGGDDLILDGISTGGKAIFTSDADIYNTTQVSSVAASGNSASANSASANSATLSGLAAGSLSLTATNGGIIGTASNPLNTSVRGVTAAASGLFLSNNTSLTLTTSGSDIAGDVSISTIGDLTLNSAVLGTAVNSVSLTATAGTLTTTGSGGDILAGGPDGTLTISAEEIGAKNDPVQTDATTINATADYGGIYIDNSATSALTLTAGAVGPTNSGTPTNNIDISSQGSIVLDPQTSTLPGAGTTPIGLYSPGGTVTLRVGAAGYIASKYDIVSGLADTSALTAGMLVSGAGIPAGDTIQDLPGPDEIVLSEPALASGNKVKLTFSTPVLTATGTVTGTTVSGLADTSLLAKGMPVTGLGIPAGDTIAQVNGAGEVTLAVAATFSGPGISLTFYSAKPAAVLPGTTTETPATYFDVYTGTLIIGSTKIVNSQSLLTGGDYGPLVTETNTAEVLVFAPIALTNAGPLELTPSMLANGGTFTGSTITIEDLGNQPQAIAGNLVLEATGAIVFLYTTNSISVVAGFSVTIETGGVAALGNITTNNGNVTIEANGNVGIGTVNAGTGTVMIASSGSIFNSNGGTLSIQAGQTNLAQAQIQVVGQGPSTAPSATNLAQLQLQAAQAFATADAASAQAAADQNTADAFQAELNSIEATVSSDELTYQSAVTATNNANNVVNADQNTVNHDTKEINNLSYAAAISSTVAASLGLAADLIVTAGDVLSVNSLTEKVGSVFVVVGDIIGMGADIANLVGASLYVQSSENAFILYNDSNTLSTDSGTAATDQSAQDVAYARLLADQDEVTAVAAAYGVAEQDAASDAIVAQQHHAVAQADSALVLAASSQASAQTAAASVAATATAQPLTVTGPLTITGEAPQSGTSKTGLAVSAPITVAATTGTGAQVSFTATNGAITSVKMTPAVGGSGYPASSTFTLEVTGGSGIGGLVQATTNSSGVVTSFNATPVAPGSGYATTSAASTALAGVTLDGNGSPMTVSGNITAPGPIMLEAPATLSGGGSLTVSAGAILQSSAPIILSAGGNTGTGGGATLTVAGTLNAPSATIYARSTTLPDQGNDIFTITPSPTTPITVVGGQGTDTLNVNFNTAGLAVTISETQTTTGTQTLSSGTIAAPGMQTITFTNIAAVTITDAAGGAGIMLNGNSLVANTMTLVGSGQGAGTVTLDNVPLSFSGVASFSYQGGGKGDTISVIPFATPEVPWALAVTVAGGTGSPASLTYNSVASLADTVTATGNDAGVVGSPGLTAVQFSNVSTITANATQSPGDQLTVSLASKFAQGVNDTLTAQQTAANTVAFTLNASSAAFSMSSIGYGSVNLSDTTGTALFEVGVAAALETNPTASVNFNMVGSPVYKDHLLVQDEGSKPKGTSDSTSPSGIAGSGLVTVGALNPVTYQNILSVQILPAMTVTDAGGTYNGKAFPATAKVLGAASLGKITPTLTYYSYSGTSTPTVNYYTEKFTAPIGAVILSGAPTKAGTYAVEAAFAGIGIYAPNWAWKTFTISQAAAKASVHLLGTRAPTVTAGGPYTISEGGSLTLRATGTDANGAALTYSWNVNGTDTFGQAVGKDATLTWSQLAALGIRPNGTAPGTYQVRVMVHDADGQVVTSAPVTLTVKYVPPIPSISGPGVAIVNGTYTLDFSARDTFSNPITSWTITWGDGTSSNVPILNGKPTCVTHRYTTSGHFVITASADNGLGSFDAIDRVHVKVANVGYRQAGK